MPSIVILSQHCDVLNQRQLTYSLINVNQRQLLLGYGLATQRQRGPSLIDVALFPTLAPRAPNSPPRATRLQRMAQLVEDCERPQLLQLSYTTTF